MRYNTSTPASTCGLGVIYDFNQAYADFPTTRPLVHEGGTPYFVAGFIDNKACEEMYEWLCKEAELVYQTPVTENKNSGRMFFSCMFKSLTNRYGFKAVDAEFQ